MEGNPPVITNYVSALMMALAISLAIEGAIPWIANVGDYPIVNEIILIVVAVTIFVLSLALFKGYRAAYIITPIVLIGTMAWGIDSMMFDTSTDLYVRSLICIACTLLLLVPGSMRGYFLSGRKVTA